MPKRSSDSDLALREDIRLLGRVLGDTIRAQAGANVFDLVERIRRTAIRYRREQDPQIAPHLVRFAPRSAFFCFS